MPGSDLLEYKWAKMESLLKSQVRTMYGNAVGVARRSRTTRDATVHRRKSGKLSMLCFTSKLLGFSITGGLYRRSFNI